MQHKGEDPAGELSSTLGMLQALLHKCRRQGNLCAAPALRQQDVEVPELWRPLGDQGVTLDGVGVQRVQLFCHQELDAEVLAVPGLVRQVAHVEGDQRHAASRRKVDWPELPLVDRGVSRSGDPLLWRQKRVDGIEALHDHIQLFLHVGDRLPLHAVPQLHGTIADGHGTEGAARHRALPLCIPSLHLLLQGLLDVEEIVASHEVEIVNLSAFSPHIG
mmetsp:Transcript_75105/g.179274  ORF Transcript_75105/g.179274 Transcript_75105/m.179274 type:complete len:218 (+) Transcript_75105:3989-4642(+)